MSFLKKFIKKLYHLFWFLSLFLLFLPKVNAIVNIGGTAFEQSPQVEFYDNTGGNLTSKGSSFYSSQGYWVSNDNIITNGGSSDGSNIGLTVNGTFVAGYTYSLSLLIGMESSSVKPSGTRICTAENLANAAYRFSHSEYTCTNAFSIVSMYGVANFDYNGYSLSYGMITYVFTADFTAPTVSVVYQSNRGNNSRHIFGGYHLETIAQPNNGLTQQQVQSIVSNSGLATANSVSQVQQSISQIQSDINSSANNIINNNNSNTQSIINNQDSNTQQQIESQLVCSSYDKANIINNEQYLTSSGSINSASNWGITNYISLNSKAKLSVIEPLNTSTSTNSCFYNVNKSLISCFSNISTGEITIPTNASFVRFSINTSLNKPQFQICRNGNQAIDDTLNDSSIDSSDSTISSLTNQIPTNFVISDLLLLPVRFLQNFVKI